jgi:hypothetical protein
VKIYINGNEADITLETEKTVGDVLYAFDEEAAKQNAVIAGVEIDGERITDERMEADFQKEISTVEKLALSVITSEEVKQSLKAICAEFEQTAERLAEVPVQLQSGKQLDASKTIRDTADIIDEFCYWGRILVLFRLEFETFLVDRKTLPDFFADFTPVLQDFCKAFENDDIVLIGDLAEYEIKPRILLLADALGGL